MGCSYSDNEVRRSRLRAQRLDPRNATKSVEEAITGVCGLQAQSDSAAALGVRARSRGLTKFDVKAAQFEDRSIVRTWCMRGSLHFVATKDVPWLLSVFGPVFVARSRRRLEELGFDDDACDEAIETIQNALQEQESLTRSEIAGSLQRAGFAFDASGQAPYHLIRRAALLGIVCEVAPKEGEEAYGLLDEWVTLDEFPDRESVLSTLTRRYLMASQPASLDDFATWSGLPMADVRTGWAAIDEETITVRNGACQMKVLTHEFTSEPSTDYTSLRFLPAYDSYLLGYDTRNHTVSPDDESRIRPGGGVIRPFVVHDGRAVATWKLDRSRTHLVVRINPFGMFTSDLEPLLRAEIDDLGRFLDTKLDYQFTDN